MGKYNAIDLFSGAGGLSYGFESAGFNILLGIDNDKKALETFELNHKGAKSICGDITQIRYEENIKPLIGDKTIDVIIGGPPCQGMSLSGPRKFDDPRNKLYLSYIRLQHFSKSNQRHSLGTHLLFCVKWRSLRKKRIMRKS